MGSDRGLHETPPALPVRPYLFQALAPEGRHESRVQHLELRAGGPAACRVSCVLLEPGHEPGTRQQVEVVGERRGVAGVLELTQHLVVGDHLARVAAGELEEPPQERRLVYAREQQHVAGDRKSTRLNSSHVKISYAVFCLKKKKKTKRTSED